MRRQFWLQLPDSGQYASTNFLAAKRDWPLNQTADMTITKEEANATNILTSKMGDGEWNYLVLFFFLFVFIFLNLLNFY